MSYELITGTESLRMKPSKWKLDIYINAHHIDLHLSHGPEDLEFLLQIYVEFTGRVVVRVIIQTLCTLINLHVSRRFVA